MKKNIEFIAANISATFISAIMAIFLLVSIPAASALIEVQTYSTTESFFITSSTALNLCSCQTSSDTITLTNVGALPVTLTLASSLPVSFSQNPVTVNSGTSKKVSLLISAACDYTYDGVLEITATSTSGRATSFKKTLTVAKCQNLAADVSINSQQGNITQMLPCQDVTGTLTVQNVGTFADTYTFSISGPAKMQSEFSKNNILLKPQEYQQIPFHFMLDCPFYGPGKVLVTVQSQNNKLESTIPVPVNVQQKYDYSMDFSGSKPLTICEQDSVGISLRIKNGMKFANSYNIGFSSNPEAVFVQWPNQTTVNIEANQTINMPVTLAPAQGAKGDYALKVTAHSQIGNADQEAILPVTVQQCYNLKAWNVQNSYTQCTGSFSAPVIIRNDGRFQEKISLSLEAPDFLKLSKTTLTLKPDSEEIVYVQGNLPDDTSFYQASVVAKLSNGLQSKASFQINGLNLDSCYAVAITGAGKGITNNLGLNTIGYSAKSIPIQLESRGFADDYYLLMLDKTTPDWIKLDIDQVQLGKQNRTVVQLRTSQNENTTAATYTATIIAAPLSHPEITYNLPVKIELVKPSLIERTFAFLFNSRCTQISTLLIALVIISFVVFLIVPKQAFSKQFRRSHRVSLRIFGLLLVLFVIGLAYLVQGIPAPNKYAPLPTSNDSLTITWYQDEQYEIDLSQYFFSPEGEQLNYTAQTTPDVEVSIDHTTAVLKPKPGFSGTVPLVLKASDESNYTAESPIMHLQVLPVSRGTATEYVLSYCEAINVLLAGAIFFTAYLLLIRLKRKKKQA
jgi:uncharacterized membrane protein